MLNASRYKIATPPLCWCCFPLRFGTPATAQMFHQLSITSLGRNLPDRWCSVKVITDTLWMMGRLKIYFHFSCENPLILIVTHLKSTCVGTAVEVCEEDSYPEGRFFCFFLLWESDVLSRLLYSVEDFWLVLGFCGNWYVHSRPCTEHPPPCPPEWEVPLVLQNNLLARLITPKPLFLMETRTQQ